MEKGCVTAEVTQPYLIHNEYPSFNAAVFAAHWSVTRFEKSNIEFKIWSFCRRYPKYIFVLYLHIAYHLSVDYFDIELSVFDVVFLAEIV